MANKKPMMFGDGDVCVGQFTCHLSDILNDYKRNNMDRDNGNGLVRMAEMLRKYAGVYESKAGKLNKREVE